MVMKLLENNLTFKKHWH